MTELNRHNDATGLIQSLKAQAGKPYLGDVETVRRLVRGFAAGIVERYDEVGHGVLAPADAAEADRQACIDMANRFCGLDEKFASVPDWTGAPLAQYVREVMSRDIEPSDDDVTQVASAFAVLAHKVYDVLRDGGATAEAALNQVNRDCDSLSNALMGVVGND